MAYPNFMNSYDWVDGWRQAWRLPSTQLGAMARALDDRNVKPPWIAAAQALGFEPPALTLRRTQSASLSLLRRLTEPYSKPVFGIDNVEIDGVEHTVNEEVIVQRPFCRLLRFDVANRQEAPHVLLVAPMAGHYATLLRETVRDLLPAYTVFITDWADAREVPMHEGGFDLDDYINYLVAFVRQLGPTTHLVAVCQAGVPAAATVALLEGGSIGDGVLPASLTVMGSPIDVSRSPTQVNQLAAGHDDGWFADTLITTVPARFPGAHRAVYPGYLQLTAFVAMNPERHQKSARAAIDHFADGDYEAADKIDSFYGEFLSTMDLTAEFYLQTVHRVFKQNALANGTFAFRGTPVSLDSIEKTPILAIEGGRDDITGLGQTRALLELTTKLPESSKRHLVLEETGHYGLFSGSKFRSQIVPELCAFHEKMD